MAKGKGKTGVNRHIHARVSYLHRAAKYLARCEESNSPAPHTSSSDAHSTQPPQPGDEQRLEDDVTSKKVSPQVRALPQYSGGLSFHLNTQLFQVARKAQIRLGPEIKHSVCKRCNASFCAPSSCRRYTENLSRAGRKPLADVTVVECMACGATRRFPIGARRQKRKGSRIAPIRSDEGQQEGAVSKMANGSELSPNPPSV